MKSSIRFDFLKIINYFISMKTLFISLLLMLVGFSGASQSGNGGQFNENNSVRLRFAGYQKTWIVNKQTCNAVMRIRYGNTTTTYNVLAKDSFLFETPVDTKLAAKTETNCGSADFGWVELSLQHTLPVKFISFNTYPLGGNELLVKFEVAESVNVKHFEVELSKDGITWQTVALVFPDLLQPNRLYSIKVNLKK
jgi:hypothetical protein